MAIEFDRAKSARNVAMGRLPFDAAERFIWSTSTIGVSAVQRSDTSTRFFALGEIDGTLHALFFTIGENGIRVVSLRPACRKERTAWLANQ